MSETEDRLSRLEGAHRTMSDEVQQHGITLRGIGDDVRRARDEAAEALRQTQSSHRVLTEHVERAVTALGARIDSHLHQQDDHLKAQDETIAKLAKPIEELHLDAIDRSTREKIKAEEDARATALALERRFRRNDFLKNAGIVFAILGGLSALFGASHEAGLWLLHALHLFGH